jgi:hypothetical protein
MNSIKSFKDHLFTITEKDFESSAVNLFKFQVKKNFFYKSYIEKLNIDPKTITSIKKIPFLPVSFFKSHEILIDGEESIGYFASSGTTKSARSKHYITDFDFYTSVSKTIFEKFYHPLPDSVILALLPSYLENPHSSLIFMIKEFIKESQNPLSGFVKDKEELYARIEKAGNKKVHLFGVSYALMDLAESGADLQGVTVIETGGMKGKRKEITRQELHEVLKKGLNLEQIDSEYGMCELLSQSYMRNSDLFSCPPWMKIYTREVNDPLSDNTGERTGIIKIIDLANIHSCAFIETEDLGMVYPNGFSVLGRVDNSEQRGCNLMYL